MPSRSSGASQAPVRTEDNVPGPWKPRNGREALHPLRLVRHPVGGGIAEEHAEEEHDGGDPRTVRKKSIT